MSVQRDSAPASGGTLLDAPSSNPSRGIEANFDSGPGDYNSSDLMREEGEDEQYATDEREPGDDDQAEGQERQEGEGEPQDEGQEPEVELAPIEPPANWPDEARQAFLQLPRQLQHHYMNSAKYMLADYTRKTQQIAQERRGIQEINQAIQPRLNGWALAGVSPGQAIHQLLALSDYADKDFGGFVKYLAKQRGIDLQTALGLNEEESDEYIDPQVKGLQEKLSDLEQMLQQAGQHSQQQAKAQQVAQYQRAFQTTRAGIDQFAAQKNADGSAKYPFFEHLENDMAGLIESGLANSIDDAYDRALHANPQTRRLVQQRQQAQQNEQLRKRAASASKAGSSITGAHANGGASNTDGMSIRGLLEAASDGRL